MVGAENRVRQIAEDIVDHYEQRLEVLDGKAMLVCMSRRICIDLYRELVQLRPDWHDDADEKGAIKVVMTGSASDPSIGSLTYETSRAGKPWQNASEMLTIPCRSCW